MYTTIFTTMLQRECYVDLKKLIIDDERGITRFGVTGNPGIGKTYFGIYLLIKKGKEQASTISLIFFTQPFELQGIQGLVKHTLGYHSIELQGIQGLAKHTLGYHSSHRESRDW